MSPNTLATVENGRAAQAPAMISHRLGIGLKDLGHIMAASGYFKDAQHEAQAIVKILYGEELGIQPVSAMMGIHIIEGKPAPSANLVATLVKKHPKYDYAVRYWERDGCTLEFFESGQSVGEVSFNEQDARSAGLAGRKMWQQYPKAMYFARALTMGVRTFAADVFGGAPVYTPEELGCEVDEDGNPVNLKAPAAPAGTQRRQSAPRSSSVPRNNGAPAPAPASTQPVADEPAEPADARLTTPATAVQKNVILNLGKDLYGDQAVVELNKLLNKPWPEHTEAEADHIIDELRKRLKEVMSNRKPTQAGMVRDALERQKAAEKAEKEAAKQARAAKSSGEKPAIAPIFTLMAEIGLPNVRELRIAALNLYLERTGDQPVASFSQLTQSQVNGFLQAIKNDQCAWDDEGNYWVNVDGFVGFNINRFSSTTEAAPDETEQFEAPAEAEGSFI